VSGAAPLGHRGCPLTVGSRRSRLARRAPFSKAAASLAARPTLAEHLRRHTWPEVEKHDGFANDGVVGCIEAGRAADVPAFEERGPYTTGEVCCIYRVANHVKSIERRPFR
jgi:hypothetical protein